MFIEIVGGINLADKPYAQWTTEAKHDCEISEIGAEVIEKKKN